MKIYKNKIFVYINYYNNRPIFKNITNLFKSGDKKYIDLKNIKKMSINKNWILIISTNKGILNHFEAIENKTGGLLLVKISN